MGHQRGADFYNAKTKYVGLPLEDSPWRFLYEAAARFLPGPEARVAELACGAGRFARLLANLGYRHYVGVDFAAARVELARVYVPGFDFRVGDLLADELPEGDVYVMLEFLEHVEADLEILGRIPAGRRVVFSVPNHDSPGHVRWFASSEEARARYAGLVEIAEVAELSKPHRPERRVFLFRGRRR